MARKKQVMQDLPVDRVDEFFKNNYKIIITSVAVVVFLFIAGYSVTTLMKSNNRVKKEAIGQLEATGLNNAASIASFAELANTITSEKNYIHLKAAESYAAIGDIDNAIAQAAKVGGAYAPYAENLMFDLKKIKGEDAILSSGGLFASLWYYRDAIEAKDDARAALIEKLRGSYPSSMLLVQLNKWGIK